MRKTILTLISAFCLLLTANAQSEEPTYTILIGQSVEWETDADIKTIIKSGNIDCVKVTHTGNKAVIRGVKLGLAKLHASLQGGGKEKCQVRVTDSSAEKQWTGPYELKIPVDNWHIALRELETGYVDHAARIGHIFAEVNQNEPHIGTIYERFNFNTRRGYQASSLDPKFRHTDDAGDDEDWDLERYFREFAPKDVNRSFLDGAFQLAEFGYVGTGFEDYHGDVLQDFHTYGWPTSKLARYYAGDETFLGIKCWKFDTRKAPPSGDMGAVYWIDPSNGLCLKKVRTDGGGFEVVIYDLDYHNWTSDVFPEGFKE